MMRRWLNFGVYMLVFRSLISSQVLTDTPFCAHYHTNTIEVRAFFPSDVKVDFSSLKVSEAAAILSNYLRFPSYSGLEDEAGRYITEVARQKGLYIQELRGPEGEFNAVVSLYPLHKQKPNVIFLNHIDVVRAGNIDDWEFPPFAGVISENQVWGRGAHDNKGSAIAQLMALVHFKQRIKNEEGDINFSVLFLSGEEIFHPGGAKYVSENYMDLLNPLVCIGEGPPGILGMIPSKPNSLVFPISVSNKRVLWLKLKLDYESSGHGSVPPNNYPNKDMVAAIHNILESKQPIIINRYNTTLLHTLGDLEGSFKGFLIKNLHLFKPFAKKIIRKDPFYNSLFSNTISLTEIKNYSDAHNSIPSKVEAYLDCRLMPGTDTQKFLNALKKKIRNPDIHIEIIKETPDAQPSSPDNPVYSHLESAIKSVYGDAIIAPIMMQASSDSNFFRTQDIPVFCTVPILLTTNLMKKIHANNERIPLKSLDNAVVIFSNFINNLNDHYHHNDFRMKHSQNVGQDN